MCSERHVKPFYLNFSSRPTVIKQKAQKIDLKKWEISLRDFKSKEPSKSNELCKELNLCKKEINEIPKKIFFDNTRKSLKRKSISDKNRIETDLLNSQPLCSSLQNCKKTTRNTDFNFRAIQATLENKTLGVACESKSKFEQVQCVFSKKAHKALKRRPMLENNAIEVDFLNLNSQSNVLCSFSFIRSPQKEEKTYLRQNPSFNIYNIEAAFEKKPHDVRSTDVLLCDSNPNLGQNALFEKVKDLKKLPKNNFIIPKDFFPDNFEQVLLKSASSFNILSSGSVSFKTNENFMNTNHQAVKIDHQDISKNSFKADLKSTLSGGCSVSPIGVGSNWIHSIEQIKEDHLQCEEKKKIQNLLIGGYCEQILKFQRQELSEKAIIEYRNEFKTMSDMGILRIKSIIHDYEIVVAECCVLDGSTNADKLTNEVSTLALNEGLTYIVFFQKSSFYKQQMKTGKYFMLSLPWYLIQLKCFKNPVIICKYFKVLSMEQTLQNLSNKESLKENTMEFQNLELNPCNSVVNGCPSKTFKSIQKEDIFFMLKGRINLFAKIQRIWDHRFSDMRLIKLLNDQKMYRLLLQTRNGNFYLLSISSHHYLDWLMSVEINEGHFYFFENLNVSHRLEKRRYPTFFKYLQNLSKENMLTEGKQKFVYQLFIGEMTKKPSRIIETDLPPFLSLNFQSLSNLIKNSAGRASCKVKVLLQYSSILYVSDESISNSGEIDYVKVFLTEPVVSFPNSEICITEALMLGGNLYLDEYSQISSLPLLNESLSTLNLQDGRLQMRHDSNVADIAIVEGHIINVDENNACIWLQCNFCMNENLVQNTNEVIFCEDCCLVVSSPILKVKMIVTVASERLRNVLLNIELSSPTVKRILSLKENSYQPQCDVSDVLGKAIGPLLCYVKGVDVLESHTLFYLNEVKGVHH